METSNRYDGIGAALALALLLLGLGSLPSADPPLVSGSSPCPEPGYIEAAGTIPEPGVFAFCSENVTMADIFLRAKGLPCDLAGDPAWTQQCIPSGTRVVFGGVRPQPEIRLEPMSAFHRMTLGMAVPLNRVPEEELTALPGVGTELARAIVEHRREAGGFGRTEDLLNVRGIGTGILDRLRPHVVVP